MSKTRRHRLIRLVLGASSVALVATLATSAGQAQNRTGRAEAITFAKDIAPILQDKCEICHRAEGMAPMSLTTFNEIRPWVRSIRQKVVGRDMPPWYVDKTVGIQKFANDRSLTDREIDLIARWVDAGAPMGDPKDLPKAKTWPGENVWQFADYFGRPPDLIVKSPDYSMAAVSQDRWWEVRGVPAIPEDRWVAGTETRPAKRSRKVVHHATTMLFQRETAEVRDFARAARTGKINPAVLYPSDKKEDPAKLLDPTPAGQAFSEWAVGKNGELYVEHDAGQFLRAGSEIGWDIHLSASGEETPVEVETAFWFYPKDTLPKYRAMMNTFGYAQSRDIDIPPGQVSRLEGYTTLPAPAIIREFPAAHALPRQGVHDGGDRWPHAKC